MLNFPKNAVYKVAIDCHMSDGTAKWVSGLGETVKGQTNESSNGACVRLGLLLNETRKDTGKLRLPDDIVRCFLGSAVEESWYPAWKNWILYGNKSRNKKIDESKLPSPATATHTNGADKEMSCYQPTPEDIEHILEEIDPNDYGVAEDELRDQIELDAKKTGKDLCSDWWKNLQTANESTENLG